MRKRAPDWIRRPPFSIQVLRLFRGPGDAVYFGQFLDTLVDDLLAAHVQVVIEILIVHRVEICYGGGHGLGQQLVALLGQAGADFGL